MPPLKKNHFAKSTKGKNTLQTFLCTILRSFSKVKKSVPAS